MPIGTCKLTGEVGPLVKAHILPASLTSPSPGGFPFAQAGRDHPPIKRWTSWYDPNIVTRVGEDILERYDTWAVASLRQHRLVWSGWGEDQALSAPDFIRIPGVEEWGFRKIVNLDGARLRLFFLSLLWRAAVSEMVEFNEIQIGAAESRRLRKMVAEGNPNPLHRFPMTLTQLTTKGDVHNLTPLAQQRPRGAFRGDKRLIPIFRFYFDGLIVHIHRKSNAKEVAQLGNMIVGASESLVLGTVDFEGSWQRTNMDELVRETTEQWPERLSRIPGFGQTG